MINELRARNPFFKRANYNTAILYVCLITREISMRQNTMPKSGKQKISNKKCKNILSTPSWSLDTISSAVLHCSRTRRGSSSWCSMSVPHVRRNIGGPLLFATSRGMVRGPRRRRGFGVNRFIHAQTLHTLIKISCHNYESNDLARIWCKTIVFPCFVLGWRQESGEKTVPDSCVCRGKKEKKDGSLSVLPSK